MSFTETEVTAMRATLIKEFAAISKKHGINLDFKTMTYDEDIRFKLHISKKIEQI